MLKEMKKKRQKTEVFQAYGMTYIMVWWIWPQMQETMFCSGFEFKKEKKSNSKYSKFIDGTGYYTLQHLTRILLVAILNAYSSRYTVITPTHVISLCFPLPKDLPKERCLFHTAVSWQYTPRAIKLIQNTAGAWQVNAKGKQLIWIVCSLWIS